MSENDNQNFFATPSSDDIWNAIKQMNPASSPRHDGFIGYFYLTCWDITKADLCDFLVDFF